MTDYALIFWSWVKYLVNDVILRDDLQGTPAYAGMGLFVSMGVYDAFSKTANNLLPVMEAILITNNITALGYTNCTSYFNDTM